MTDPTQAADEEPGLAGASGDDISAGTSVSGVGGEAMRTENEDAGLRPVNEQAERIAWGKDVPEDGVQTAANDGTGQSEEPSG